jgi:hypothetical protein
MNEEIITATMENKLIKIKYSIEKIIGKPSIW